MQPLIDNDTAIEHRIDALAQCAGAARLSASKTRVDALMGALPVVHRPNLFTPKRELRPAGLSIAQIVQSIDTLPAAFWERGIVTIDRRDGEGSQLVPRERWRYVKPKVDGPIPIEVNLWLPPGDGGSNILSIVASIAVLAATIFAAPLIAPFVAGALGIGSTVALAATQAAIAIGGALAIQALSPPPSLSALTTGGGGIADSAQSINPASVSGNVLRPGAPIPHCRGRRKAFPPIVVKPLIELIGDDEYASAVFGLSGAHDFDNLRADGVPFDDIEELEYQTREGHSNDTQITLITRQSKTDTAAVELSPHKVDADNPQRLDDQVTPSNSLPQWHRSRALGSPDEIWISLGFPEGLFDADSVSADMGVGMRLRFRRVGQSNWINAPEIHFTYRQQQRFQKDIRLIFDTESTAPQTPGTKRCPRAAFSHVPMRSDTFIGGANVDNKGNAFDGASSNVASRTTGGSFTNEYCGANYSSAPRTLIGAVVWPHTTDGFFSGGIGTTINLKLRGKTGSAPASSSDGTLLGSTGAIADTTTPQWFTSNDTTTQWHYLWIEGETDGFVSQMHWAEIQFLGDNDYAWRADSYFYSAVQPSFMDSTNIATTGVRRVELYEDRAEITLDPATFPKGDYEIEIKRGAAYALSVFNSTTRLTYDTFSYVTSGGFHIIPYSYSNVFHKIVRQRFSLIWNEHPLRNAPGNLALIAVRVKNRQINQVSVDAARYVNDWDGAAWASPSTTANPAAHVRDILAGDLNADRLPDDLIDDDTLVAWRTRCANEGREIRAVIEGASAEVTAQLACGCGYARLRQSDTFGVIEDKDRSAESPVQTFTSRNSRGYHFEKAFVRQPTGLRCIFADAANDYQETEFIIDDPDNSEGTGTDGRYEEMRYDGLVTEAAVIERALHDMKQARLRMAFHSFEANGQAIKCQRGDLIGLNHPILEAQMGSAYVNEVLTAGNDVIGLTLDGTVPVAGSDGFFSGPDALIADLYGDGLWTGGNIGAVIRLRDGNGDLTAQINPDAEGDAESRSITFTTPIPGPIAGLDRDCLVTVGQLGEERLRLILTEIAPKAGPSYPAVLTAVDEATSLWSS